MASNVLPHKDRNSINELGSAANGTSRRPPANNRDASGQKPWKNPTATSIPVPGQVQRLLDPYTPRNAFSANRTALQTITAGRHSKRQPPSRIDIQKSASSFVRGYGKSKGKQKAVLAPQHDTVDVDDDEDLGQPLSLSATRARSSPDQLDCIQSRHFRTPTELETQVRLPPIHPFDEMDDRNAASSSKTPHISHHHTQSSSDPIEEYQPSPPPARPLSTSGRVQGMVSKINAQNQSIGLSAPHVDLAKEEKAKTKDRMKPKRGHILKVETAPQVQHPRLQVKRAFIGLQEYGERQTSFQYSSKQLILTIHRKPSESLVFALNGEVFRLSVSHTVLLAFYLYECHLHEKMSNRQAEEPFLMFSAIRLGYSGSRLQLGQSEEGGSHYSIMTTQYSQRLGNVDLGRVLLLFEDDQPGLKEKIAGLVEVTRTLDGAEYLDGAGARGIFEREMRLLEDLKRRRSSDGLEGSKTRRTVPTTKPISGIKRKITDEDQVTEGPPLGPPRKRSTYPSEDVADHSPKPRVETLDPRRRSARQTLMADGLPRQPRPDPDDIILVYPPNTTGAVTIKNSDLDRLQPGEFLNDTLIEFGLKLWLKDLEESHPELAKDVYVFSSFFYKKLKVRNVEDGYQSVRKWTSKFDIFQKKYIIVPINENRSKTPSDLQEVVDQLEPESEDEDTTMSSDEPPIEPQPSVESGSNHIIIDETPSAGPSLLSSNGVGVTQFYGTSSKRPAPKFTTPPIFHSVDDQAGVDATPEVQMGDPQPPRTYIFTLDSLGTRHTAVYKTLNTYLKLEAKDKKDFDLTSEGVGDYREKLAARIKELSVIWKRDKGVKNPDAQEAQADPSTRASSSKTSPEIDVVPDSEGSDEDIEIVGMSRSNDQHHYY
ncbi:hypothetical protein PC9H_010810 [Pleurotus ostreatus]|uniref:Ubiquitin-like protease family profile domain-containing protein n=2 Tax=Pleurotus ostreatus TaxID=5322 RepID=A0A8H7DNZ6_PLEOS|nr:uncharacterized protein PC9H_010810 [Pleurotus ostreatus]KAF7422654.1 hypothetical protein PC9H_010810 [Pleurotus ostreatus]